LPTALRIRSGCISYNTYSSWAANTPLKDDSIKQAVLKRLYNARTDLSDFIAEKLKEDGFDDITDSQGWMDRTI